MEKNIIFIKNFITNCYIGIYPEEKDTKQKIKISVKLNIIRKEKKDKISSTVCYENILNILNNIPNYGHLNLVETLAGNLASDFKKIGNVKKIYIKINKCEILPEGSETGYIYKSTIK